MIQTVQQIDMTVRSPQTDGQPQTAGTQKTDGFHSLLKSARKAAAKTAESAGKTGDASDSSGKTEKAGEGPGTGAVSAASANGVQSVLIPVAAQQTQKSAQSRIADAALQIPSAEVQTGGSAQTIPVRQIPVQQIPAETAEPQIPPEAQTLPQQAAAVPRTAEQQSAQEISRTEQPPAGSAQAGPPSAAFGEPQKGIGETAAAAQTNAVPVPAVRPSGGAGEQTAPETAASAAEGKTETAAEKEPVQDNRTSPGIRQFSDLYSGGRVVVKISDVPAAAKTPLSSQISNAVAEGLKTGKRQIQVDLYPQSLGKVSVKLASENGVLTVEIAAANPKTQSLLASSSGEIRSLLHASTGQTVQVTGQQQNAQQYAGQNGDSSRQQSAQQQQQQENAQKHRQAQWYTAGNSAGFSTGDFLTALKSTAV